MEQGYQITPEEIRQLEEDLALNDALQRLMKNRDFKKIVLEMYLKDGSVMIMKNLAKIKYRKEANMEVINDALIARSLLDGFFGDIERNAKDAVEALREEE